MNKVFILRTLNTACRHKSTLPAFMSCKSAHKRMCVRGNHSWSLFRKSRESCAVSNKITSKPFQQTRMFSAPVSMKPDVLTVWERGNILHIEWPDGSKSRFQSVWLRHNCHCPECKQLDSGQKTLDIVGITPDIAIETAEIKGKEVEIRWNSGHTGVVPLDFLLLNDYSSEALERRAKEVHLTDNFTATSIPTIAYSELMKSQQNVLSWMNIINKFGFCFLTGVPLEDSMVMKVAELIDKPQITIYGETFDVVSTPTPINIAYSTVELDLHMDLVYYESPPGLQLLHTIRFDECVQGGDSVFLDSFQVAKDFRKIYPDHFDTLVRIPATFQKIHYARESPVHMTYQRPHIVLNRRKEIVCINWAPSFEGSLSVPENEVKKYYEAYQKFAQALKDSPHRLTQQLRVGDLVVFNNRRILHGRHNFQLNGGVRHLRGCYVNIDHFKSKLQYLTNTIGDGQPVKRVGNQDWF